LNQATSQFDLSQLYGTDDDVEDKLRSFQGKLLTSTDDNLLLPLTTDEICFMPHDNSTCYQSGDSRVNVNPLVTSLYTLFLRSHNKIASKLLKMNPTLGNDQLFNITKDINVAIYQKIIYNDWANVVLGKQMALEIRNTNDDQDGKHVKSERVSNEFGAAAIKFYNTLLPGDLMSNQEESARSFSSENVIEAAGIVNLKRKEILKLQNSFYTPRDLNKNLFLDQLMNAALRQNSMEFDSSYVEALSLQLYRSNMQGNRVFGGDSLAFDIQRTRDHGLQPYINYIKKCFNMRITQWDDLRNIVKEDDLNKLRTVYESVKDIDLLVGGLSEIPRENVTVGQTFACILSEFNEVKLRFVMFSSVWETFLSILRTPSPMRNCRN
jgi:peroxidase